MKHKLTNSKLTARLIFYFSAVLLVFAAVVGSLFVFLSSRSAAEVYIEEMQRRAESIAEMLSSMPASSGRHGHNGGYGNYINQLDKIAMCEVWLADERAQTIQMGHDGHNMVYGELPLEAEKMLGRVFQGHTEVSRDFSAVFAVPYVTVGAPIRARDGKVAFALLLHSPVSGAGQAARSGLFILAACMLAALLLAAFLSVLLATRFIRPLRRMEETAGKLIKGDYTARTGVVQDDEIGSLAQSLDELSGRLLQAEKEGEKLEKMRQDFISNISHELRTPVTVLRGSLEVLTGGLIKDPAEMQEYFQQMTADTLHLQRLVNDLLELSRLQNLDFKIEKAELNLPDVVGEAVRSMRRVADKKQVGIKLVNEKGVFPVIGDYGRLRQMLTILIDNAVKFSPEGGSVEITVSEKENGCLISIRDYGCGIPAEDLPHIFDRFYRERSAANQSGTGLGLPIAKEIALRHHALLTCKSENGAEFQIFFPPTAASGV